MELDFVTQIPSTSKEEQKRLRRPKKLNDAEYRSSKLKNIQKIYDCYLLMK